MRHPVVEVGDGGQAPLWFRGDAFRTMIIQA